MVKEKTKMICIDCPIGCEINVTHDGKIVLEIDGNKCKKGIDYTETEITDPRRVVITTVRVRGGFHHLVPVRSTEPVPKTKIFSILKKLRKVELKTPVKIHQVVLPDAVGTGIDIVTSRSLSPKLK